MLPATTNFMYININLFNLQWFKYKFFLISLQNGCFTVFVTGRCTSCDGKLQLDCQLLYPIWTQWFDWKVTENKLA